MAGEGEAWRRANHYLRLHLPEGPSGAAWRSFVSELFRKVELWEEQERRNFRHITWDFCIIHSKHPADAEKAGALRDLLENSLGLYGRTLADIEAGECTLEAAEAMVEGSTKVFILTTKYMNRFDVNKYIFQEVLMEELRQAKWRCKVIPLEEHGRCKRIFGLKGINGLILGDDPSTVEMMSNEISLETQMEVREARRRAEAIHNERLTRLRASRHQEIREVVAGLRQRFGDNYDPTSQLDQMTEALRSMTVTDVPGVDQLVNVNNCSNVNVGPSIHFTVKCDPSTPSDHDHSTTATPSHNEALTDHAHTPPPSRYTPTTPSSHAPTPPSSRYTPTTPSSHIPTSPSSRYTPTTPSSHAPTSPSSRYTPTTPSSHTPTFPSSRYTPTTPSSHAPTPPPSRYTPTTPSSHAPTPPPSRYTPTTPSSHAPMPPPRKHTPATQSTHAHTPSPSRYTPATPSNHAHTPSPSRYTPAIQSSHAHTPSPRKHTPATQSTHAHTPSPSRYTPATPSKHAHTPSPSRYTPTTPSSHAHTPSPSNNTPTTQSTQAHTPSPSRYTPSYTHYTFENPCYDELLSSADTSSTCLSSSTHL